MRRYRYLLVLPTVIGLALIVDRYAHQENWRPLPDGRQIRLVRVTYGERAHIKIDGSILDPLRSWLGPHWNSFLGRLPLVLDDKSDRPKLVVWFTTRLVGNNRLPSDGFTVQYGGEQIPGVRVGYFRRFMSDGTCELTGYAFDPAPVTESRLRIRYIKRDPVFDHTLDFDADNPCYSGAGHPVSNSTRAP